MAHTESSIPTSVEPTPPPAPNPHTLTMLPRLEDDEDSQEWEYEYSATETESYYVTLDLTIPELTKSSGRRRNKSEQADAASAYPQAEEDPDFQPTADPDEVDPPENLASEIQIVEFHSENPLVSYCGQLYSCRWAENIGTEIFFMKNIPKDNVSRIQILPGGVNVLGTSSVRLDSTPITAEPKTQANPAGRNGSKTRSLRREDLAIDVGPRASQGRIQQAKFLEDLIKAKEKRGETDLVTVHVEKRYTNLEWKKEVLRQRKEQRVKLQSILEGDDEQAKENARKEVAELDEEERRIPLLDVETAGDDSKELGQPVKKRQKLAQSAPRRTRSSVATVGKQSEGFSNESSRTPTPYRQLLPAPVASTSPSIVSRSSTPQQAISSSSRTSVAEGNRATAGMPNVPSNEETGVAVYGNNTAQAETTAGDASTNAQP
ncbi:hypothetical protein GLAREA_06390 [Glarea lozoyensis ATCC 20868]|uniref:Transcription factor TFIIIC triple barrel domain-containing protein n=1 Tax=Glarea lozoyensis (strain ATCC 20868 / MF5171) TaxID=1116229 RepID=S3D4K9_GLAL2|nr:uncharacterized protein GLAREA_06390 [Glarea lozoyensis ATCC 20868]EPE33377.1 hypothetical protein GLAREA_06390 [Glarea lozoyensis ATCC 20868]